MFNKDNRREVQKPLSLIADLDKIIVETVPFKLHGVVHYLKPVSAEKFFRYSVALEKMHELETSTDPKDLVDAYFNLASSMVDTITREDIENCTQAQVAGLLRLIIDAITGYQKNPQESVALNDVEVKKKTTQSTQRNLFQKFALFTTTRRKKH